MKPQITTLKVNLRDKEFSYQEEDPSKLSLEEKLGGFGKAVRLQERHLAEHPEIKYAFDQRNVLSIDLGFTTGSNLMTAKRTIISGMSPLKSSNSFTNGVMYSTASGDLGTALRSLGVDSIEMYGRSEKPVYLMIEQGKANLLDASELVGKTTHEKIHSLHGKHKGGAFAVIGPAGENLVRFAGVAFSTNDQLRNGSNHLRYAGRGGFGAVLASKNVLGIAVLGDYEPSLNLGNLLDWNKEIATGSKTKKYRELGTFFANVESSYASKSSIVDNFSENFDERQKELFKPNLTDKGYTFKNKGCLGCGIKCWKEVQKDGKTLGKIDWEPGSLLGPNLGIYDISQILELVNLSDSFGLDVMSAGVCIGFEMERLGRFGDFEFAKDLVSKISTAQHPLRDGVFRYRPGDPKAMHVKGIEFAAYLGNLNPGYAFVIGGPHRTSDTYNAWCYKDKFGAATNSVSEWVDNIDRGPQIILYDMDGLCGFSKVDFEHVAILFFNRYQEKVTPDDLRDVAKLVNHRVRKMDERLGFSSVEEVLPAYCYKDLGFIIPHFNDEKFFQEVKEGVYQRFAQNEQQWKEKGLI